MKKLRWYIIHDPEENLVFVIGSSSHSKAKITYGVFITGNLSAWESLQAFKCNVVKQKLSIEPEKEGEEFEKRGSREELVKEGIYGHAIDETCPHCQECGNIYFDQRFYCGECENEDEDIGAFIKDNPLSFCVVNKNNFDKLIEWCKEHRVPIKNPMGGYINNNQIKGNEEIVILFEVGEARLYLGVHSDRIFSNKSEFKRFWIN